MAKDLRKLYGSEFAAMLKDAKANTVEAQEHLQVATSELQEKQQILNDLQETAKSSREKFLNDAKELLVYALGRGNMVLDGLKRIAENILTYVTAKEEIPEVEKEIQKAKSVRTEAESVLYTAMSEEKAIQAFVSVKPEETEA